MIREFQRVAIVNHGIAAVRFIHAAREFNQEHGTALRTIALFTEADRRSLFAREADEAVLLAQSVASDIRGGSAGYFDYGVLEEALVAARAEAVWPGWGFAAEHAELADLCGGLGITFIGPNAEVMRRLSDRIAAKRLAEHLQIPLAPWSDGPVESLTDAVHCGERLGYPLLLKSATRNGDRAVLVPTSGDLADAYERTRSQSFQSYGNPTIFMERLLENARHIRVQIVADEYGSTRAIGVRERRYLRSQQEILIQAPPAELSQEVDELLRVAAVRMAREVGYSNVGSISFLHQRGTERLAFVEVKTSLGADHSVSECLSGTDLVKLQIHIARGGRLPEQLAREGGHAIQAQLRIDNSDGKPGTIQRLRFATGAGLRVDCGVIEAECLPPFDNTVASVTASGGTREEAVSRLARAVRESVIVVESGTTNKSSLLECLKSDSADGEPNLANPRRDAAVIAAAIEVYEAELEKEVSQFYASAERGRPQVSAEVGKNVELFFQRQGCSLTVFRIGPQQYRINSSETTFQASIERVDRFEYWLSVLGQRFHVLVIANGLRYRMEVDGVSYEVERGDRGILRAPAPAVVVSVAVKAGDRVEVGDRVAVLEAMKLEMEVKAECAGWVRQVMIIPNVQVDTRSALLQVEAESEPVVRSSELKVFAGFPAQNAEDSLPAWRAGLLELNRLMLGFDVDSRAVGRQFAQWRENATSDRTSLGQLRDEILNVFVDIQSLFCRHPEPDGDSSAEAPSVEMCLFTYLSHLRGNAGMRNEELPSSMTALLQKALRYYGVHSLERTTALEEGLFWIYKSHQRSEQQAGLLVQILENLLGEAEGSTLDEPESFRSLLNHLVTVTRETFPLLSELGREVRYRYFDQPLFDRVRTQAFAEVETQLASLATEPDGGIRYEKVRSLIESPQPLLSLFAPQFVTASLKKRELMLEVLTRRYYRIRNLSQFGTLVLKDQRFMRGEYDHEEKHVHVFTTYAQYSDLAATARMIFPEIEKVPIDDDVVLDFYLWHGKALPTAETTQKELAALLNQAGFPRAIRRIVVAVGGPGKTLSELQHFTYRPTDGAYQEEKLYRGLHPMIGKRLHLWRLNNFNIERLPSIEDVYLIRGVARDNPKDERLFACAEVRDVTPVRDAAGRVVQLPYLERMLSEAIAAIRNFQSRRAPHERLYWNRILLYVWQPLDLKPDELHDIVQKLIPETEGAGLEQVVVRARIPNPETGELRDMIVRLSSPGGSGLLITYRPATRLEALKPLSDYEQKVVRMRQRGMIYPYEIIKMLTPSLQDTKAEFPAGDFVEHDLDADGRLVPVSRPYGHNKANMIVGIVRNFTSRYPEGIKRVVLLGDPSKDLGALAEPECRRIMGALDLAREEQVPLEWFPISAGAKISMESGVENMDWIARVLRRLIEFTQAGGEVNLVVNGINVGAQPYWNAEATMLMHTRGILIMTPKAAMVLTGKRALDFSGSISAEDNLGIGGYGRIMGLNGQAQYWARDIEEGCHILLRHYEHTYIAPGERFPRRAETSDPIERDVRDSPHTNGHENAFTRVGDIFSDQTNPGRKKSFDIRKVMMAVVDQDHQPLERWPGMRAAETTVIWDAHLGGYPICLIGIESRQIPRIGFVPADGPEQWTAGTLFPMSSKKVARAINAASNNRPVVLLANLSGFDGSPESMRRLQLEYGAEIGRAVVNFKGPMAFCVINRYHGGAYVVFSRALNENLEVFALEGTYASVIGGAPAAAVVFAGEVEGRARKDPRIQKLDQEINEAANKDKARLRAQRNQLFKIVHSEKLGQVAEEFDRVHSVERARRVGALNEVIPPDRLRPYLIKAIERGLGRFSLRALKVVDVDDNLYTIREHEEAVKAS
jgi:acetyl/propionyl-CoA carboxylase alpha subunit/acetyl-CoA carboxylase carboxyltransferase component